jgi:hypothetical protein
MDIDIVFSAFFIKNGKRKLVIRHAVCLCPSKNILLNHLIDFHEIQQRDCVIKYYLYIIIFNLIVSTVPKWRTFKVLRWMQNLHESTWENEWLGMVIMETKLF